MPTGIPSSVNIANNVVIGHRCSLYSCTIDEMVYIGNGARILEGVRIEKGA